MMVTLVIFSAVPLAVAADYEAMIERAFEINAQTSLHDWAFTETYSSGKESQVSSFDPCRPKDSRWELLSVNGVAPTEEDLDEFHQDKVESDNSDEEDSGFDIVTPGSVKLIEETEQSYLFEFQPTSDDSDEDAEVMRNVNGNLSIDKGLGYVESIRFFSDKPFKPETGVKIKEMDISMTFGLAQPEESIVLKETSARIKGRAYMVVGFDENEKTTFSDFKKAECSDQTG